MVFEKLFPGLRGKKTKDKKEKDLKVKNPDWKSKKTNKKSLNSKPTIKGDKVASSKKSKAEEVDADIVHLMGPDVIVKRGNVPTYMGLMSAPKGKMPIQDENVKKDFAILSVDDEKREAILLESFEGRLENKSDHAVISMDIKQRIRRLNYKVLTMVATRAIISIVYDEAATTQDDVTEKRVGELQTDFDELIKAAVSHGTSDVHIEVRRNNAKIRFRKNGNLEDYKEIPVSYANEFGGVIYRVIAEEKDVTFQPGQPQDAVIDRQLTDQLRMRIRLATMPAYPNGFDMVMRLLPMGVTNNRKELSELGYKPVQLNDIKLAMAKPVGVSIVAGTTGSGKSTTLVTMLGKVIEDKAGTVKVITVEDPPEFELKGATQVPVVRSKKVTGRDQNPFSAAIRAAMRSDPDILLIGEVRDNDSAELLTHAVQSGHQVYTTVHAPSAIGIVSRLRSLGAKNEILGSQDFISGLIYQTLVQTLCKSCSKNSSDADEMYKTRGKASYTEFLEVMQRINYSTSDHDALNIRFKGEGCNQCTKGATGRTVVAEVIVPDHEMVTMFADGRDTEAWHHWRKNGGVTALETGISIMLDGVCDPFDLEHKLGPLTANMIMEDGVLDLNKERGILGYISPDEKEEILKNIADV
jgi:type II secretory ATPase GspE/PulE/Tfp pilus assembly ATPase PilB-like protein